MWITGSGGMVPWLGLPLAPVGQSAIVANSLGNIVECTAYLTRPRVWQCAWERHRDETLIEARQAVMGWTPPDGIDVPRWWC